ncbi:hypothetical protein [Runella salmonicolor]|uniref:Uncharacterized protein n=1 Tax=Runella salmonicolor TaxID=2950278 RepID=A0ABT1FUY4_9BACT|nr:hypothetical protein [Runella salmonicolor]MCP1385576.1 hypothetical protein [Runella salmonicolor]
MAPGLNLDRTWIGYFIEAGGHLGVAGTSSTWARVWNVNNSARSFTFTSRAYSFGPGLGGSGGGGLVVVFNLGVIANLEGTKLGKGGWSLNLDIPVTRLTKYKQIYSTIKTAQTIYGVTGIPEFIDEMYKSIILGNGAKVVMKDLTVGLQAALINNWEGTIDVRQHWRADGGYEENL